MLGTAFLLGFLGSLHCVAMCGPIATMLPVNKDNYYLINLQFLSYHIGRILTYTLIGFGIGGIAQMVSNLFDWQQHLSILAGSALILMGLFPQLNLNNAMIAKLLHRWTSIAKLKLGLSIRKKNLLSFVAIGFFNGLLPCGLVYAAALGALASPTSLDGALYMVFFGLGTVPLLGVVQYAGFAVKQSSLIKIRKWIPVFLVLVGLLFVIRGLGLHIPYLSPSTPPDLISGSNTICP